MLFIYNRMLIFDSIENTKHTRHARYLKKKELRFQLREKLISKKTRSLRTNCIDDFGKYNKISKTLDSKTPTSRANNAIR
jgi:hypothetical protein